jgi:hypothetical protein
MRIRFSDPDERNSTPTMFVQHLVRQQIERASRDVHGHTESQDAEHRELVQAFARLVDILAEKRVLTSAEVLRVAYAAYIPDPAKSVLIEEG